jgi:N-acylneuraminate cytidylyltransferase
MKSLAVIPARGGSKRIPRKNVRPFCGRPIIEWVIDIAKNASIFDAIVVSTEDDEIARISETSGAEVPFLRPVTLATDHTPTLPVVNHTIQTLQEVGRSYDFVCCIYPTSVFVSEKSLMEGLRILETTDCDYVISTTLYPHPIERALRLSKANQVVMVWPEHAETRSQDLKPSFHDAGQFYWGRIGAWASQRCILSSSVRAVTLSNSQVRDIDNQNDWMLAEQLFAQSLPR